MAHSSGNRRHPGLGLPSGPAPRSRTPDGRHRGDDYGRPSGGRHSGDDHRRPSAPSHDGYDDPRRPSHRELRPQRSMANLSSSRDAYGSSAPPPPREHRQQRPTGNARPSQHDAYGGHAPPPPRELRPQRSMANLRPPQHDGYGGHLPPPPRELRQQRSMTNLSSSQRGRSPEPGYAPSHHDERSMRSRGAPDSFDNYSMAPSDNSRSSTSSNGSLMSDRMRSIKSNDTTPRTSIDEDWPQKRQWQSEADISHLTRDEAADEEAEPAPPAAEGSWLWNKVTSVITVNVSKGWTATQSGEETPAGDESRLTKAMKAYYVTNAQQPGDLPEWLFEPHERGAAGRTQAEDAEPEYDAPPPHRDDRRHQGRMDRDRGAREAPDSGRRVPGNDAPPPPGGGTGRAADRLKAMRDAKRGAANAGSRPPERSYGGAPSRGDPRQDAYYPEERSADRDRGTRGGGQDAPRRMGLPAGPGPRRI